MPLTSRLFRVPAARRLALLCSFLMSLVATPAAAQSQAVIDWNATAIQQVTAGHTGPAGVIDVAVVQAAVHDAVQAYERVYQPYALSIGNASGSQIAAIATAARDALIGRLPPAQDAAIQPLWEAYLTSRAISLVDPGVAIGSLAATGVLALRVNDGSFPDTFPAFNGMNQVGVWRPTPPGFASMASPWAGAVVPFTTESTAGFQPAPLPGLSSGEYTEAYNEVKRYGSASSTFRTPEQNHLTRFYADNFLAQWNRALRDIAVAHQLDAGRTARLLALANLATADAFICAWEAKKFFAFWRPITAIREGHADGNDATAGDPSWTPLVTTPNYPDYTSGANNVTSAMTRILALFFESDHVIFTVSSLSPLLVAGDPTSITYYKFSDAAKDVIDVRVWQGIHFRFADTEARSQGRRVANYAFRNFLQPLGKKGAWKDIED
jgi:hypothetical protein